MDCQASRSFILVPASQERQDGKLIIYKYIPRPVVQCFVLSPESVTRWQQGIAAVLRRGKPSLRVDVYEVTRPHPSRERSSCVLTAGRMVSPSSMPLGTTHGGSGVHLWECWIPPVSTSHDEEYMHIYCSGKNPTSAPTATTSLQQDTPYQEGQHVASFLSISRHHVSIRTERRLGPIGTPRGWFRDRWRWFRRVLRSVVQ